MSGRPQRTRKPNRRSGFLYENVIKKTKPKRSAESAAASSQSVRKKAKKRTSKKKSDDEARPAAAAEDDAEEEAEQEEEEAEEEQEAAEEEAEDDDVEMQNAEDARIFRNDPASAFHINNLRLSNLSIADEDEEKKKEAEEQRRDALEGIVQQQQLNNALRSSESVMEFSADMADLNQAADETRIKEGSRVSLRNMLGRVKEILDADDAAPNMRVQVHMDNGRLEVAGFSDLTLLREPQVASSAAAIAAQSAFAEPLASQPPAVSASAMSQLENVKAMFHVGDSVRNLRVLEYGTVMRIDLGGMTVQFGMQDVRTFPLAEVLRPDFSLVPARLASQPSVHDSLMPMREMAAANNSLRKRAEKEFPVGTTIFYRKRGENGKIFEITDDEIFVKFPRGRTTRKPLKKVFKGDGLFEPARQLTSHNSGIDSPMSSDGSVSSHESASSHHSRRSHAASHHSASSRHSARPAAAAASSSAAAAAGHPAPFDIAEATSQHSARAAAAADYDYEPLDDDELDKANHLRLMLITYGKAMATDTGEIGDVVHTSREHVNIRFPTRYRIFYVRDFVEPMPLEVLTPSDPRLTQSRPAAAASSQRVPIPPFSRRPVPSIPGRSVPARASAALDPNRRVTRSIDAPGTAVNPMTFSSSSSSDDEDVPIGSLVRISRSGRAALDALARGDPDLRLLPPRPLHRRVLPASAGATRDDHISIGSNDDIVDFQTPAAAAGPARPARPAANIYTSDEDGDQDD